MLRRHQLYAKLSKCSFGVYQIDYLGHIITKDGVSTDPTKIEAMLSWTRPTTQKQLRGWANWLLFIKGYGEISKPLTDLLKKNSFCWNELAEAAFNRLKEAVTTAPV